MPKNRGYRASLQRRQFLKIGEAIVDTQELFECVGLTVGLFSSVYTVVLFIWPVISATRSMLFNFATGMRHIF